MKIEKMRNWKIISVIASLLSFVLVIYFTFNLDFPDAENSAYAQRSSITIITLTNTNSLLGGAQYSITPNPLNNIGTYTIKDNDYIDSEKDKDGIITIVGVKNGNYTISQISTSSGYNVDKFSKNVIVKDSSGVATFTNVPNISTITNSTAKNITYTAKFECGSIFAGEGPLRPGHYDTDISIFNKQNFQSSILWNVVVNDGPSSNAVLKNINPETSTGITCQEIRKILSNNDENFIEGFVIINVPLDSTLQPENGITIRNASQDAIDLLNVQVFYTANALSTLPHEVLVDKISFYIIKDDSGKIPKEMIRKTLDISVPSTLNELSDTENKVKKIIAGKYNLTDDDLKKIVVRIKDVSIGVGVLIDDHAISLSTIKPQISS